MIATRFALCQSRRLRPGNNGKDASGDIAITWPKPDVAILICAYTQGGSPSAAQFDTLFAEIGRMVG